MRKYIKKAANSEWRGDRVCHCERAEGERSNLKGLLRRGLRPLLAMTRVALRSFAMTLILIPILYSPTLTLAFADRTPEGTDACFKGGSYAGWDYEALLNPMYLGGSYDGDHMASYDTDTALGYADASKLSFSTSPSNAYAGVAFTTQPVVQILDANDNLVEDATDTVTLSILNDAAGSSTLGGTASMAAAAGVADFAGKGLNINRAAEGFTLSASSGELTTATSSTFNILSPVEITYPDGGETLTVSTAYDITWAEYGSLATGTNTVEYSVNNGDSWTEITSNGTSPQSWVTPSGASTQCLVRVTNSADATFTDASDATFKVSAGFTMVTPNGGETWANGFEHTIEWLTTGTVSNVKLEYYDGSGWNTIEASTSNTGSYGWTPDVSSGGTGFKIRVSDASDSDVNDESNSTFTLQKVSSVDTPTVGQRIQANSSTNIGYTKSGLTNVKIEYSINDGSWTEIIASTTDNPYSWSVGNDFTTSTNVKAKVSAVTADDDANTASATSSAFTIYGQLTLSAPDGAEEWAANEAHNITWTTNKGTIENVKLEYSSDNFVADENTIIASTANDGTYEWTPASTGETFKVRVSDAQDSDTSDVSDDYFSVTGIGITAPASGATWNCGSAQTITWNATGSFTHVKIEYYDGSDWNTIISSTVNDGSHGWTVENTPTNAAQIRISDAADGDPVGTSQTFNIKAVIDVTDPDGGETLAVGSSTDVTWDVTGSVTEVKLEYYNGSSWVNFTESEGTLNDGIVSNDGSFSWTVPDAITSSAKVRVSDADSGHPASSDESASTFTIKAGFDFGAPTSASNWAVNEEQDITWTTSGTVSDIRLYYATEDDAYASWTEITSGATADSETYSWTLTDIILAVGQDPQADPSLGVKIKITDATGGHPASEVISDAFNVKYYTITFTARDSQTQSDLSGLSVTCTSGWSASGLTSGIDANHNYPYGTYTTIWSKADYTDSSYSNWTADSSKTLAVTMTLSAISAQEYHVYSNFTYDSVNDSFNVNSWLEQAGAIVTEPTNCTVSMEDKDGNTVDINGAEAGTDLSSSSPNANGVFRMVWDLTNIDRNTSYLGKVQIAYQGSTYSSNVTYAISVPAVAGVAQVESLGEEFQSHRDATEDAIAAINTSVGTGLAGKVDTIQSDTATIKSDVTSVKTAVGADQGTTLYSQVASILEDTGTTIPSTIEDELKKGPRSKILTRPTTASLGDTLTIRFKTDSELSPVITIYDDSNAIKVSAADMSEIGSSGIYEYDFSVVNTWDTGDYTIVCSEPTLSSADSMVLKVAEESAGTVDALSAKVDTLTTNISTLSTDVASVKEVLGTATDTANADTLHGKLSGVSTNVDSVLTNWGSYGASDIVGYVENLETYLGDPNNVAGQQTVFGKIAEVKNDVDDTSDLESKVNAAYNEIQELRKELDFNGKSETAYSLVKGLNDTLEDVRGATSQISEGAGTGDVDKMAESVEETRKALKEMAEKEGLKGAITEEAREGPVTLDSLNNRIAELKALIEAVKTVTDKQSEEPVVKTWFESGSVVLKMIVANPSETDVKTVPVKSYLPKGIEPENIIDLGGFNISYDYEQSLYYVYRDVTLAPKESIELKVEMENIWVIPEDEIKSISDHVDRIMAMLENTEYYRQAKMLGQSIIERLDEITDKQEQPGVSIENRLSDYETHLKILREIKRDVGALEDLVIETGGVPGEKLIGATEGQQAPSISESDKAAMELETLTLTIAVSNPTTENKVMPLEYYLPEELTPRFIVDSGGLDIGFDSVKGLHYLYKKGLTLKPKQTKEFVVEINDIWFIPNVHIETISSHSKKLEDVLANTDFKDSASFLGGEITMLLSQIRQVQSQKDISMQRRVGNYRRNLRRLEEAKKNLSKLERLVIQTGGTPGITLITADNAGAGGSVKSGRGIKSATRGMELLGRSIFRGKAPTVTTTWKIIWIIVSFLAVVSFLFFILWWTQIKMSAGKKKEEVKREKK